MSDTQDGLVSRLEGVMMPLDERYVVLRISDSYYLIKRNTTYEMGRRGHRFC